jgi:hypothetical protein
VQGIFTREKLKLIFVSDYAPMIHFLGRGVGDSTVVINDKICADYIEWVLWCPSWQLDIIGFA